MFRLAIVELKGIVPLIENIGAYVEPDSTKPFYVGVEYFNDAVDVLFETGELPVASVQINSEIDLIMDTVVNFMEQHNLIKGLMESIVLLKAKGSVKIKFRT